MPEQLGPKFHDKSLKNILNGPLTTLKADSKALLDIKTIFEKERDVSLPQFESSSKKLKEIEKHLQEFRELIEESSLLQGILPYRFKLLSTLRQANVNVHELIALINGQPNNRQYPRIVDIISKLEKEIAEIQYTLRIDV